MKQFRVKEIMDELARDFGMCSPDCNCGHCVNRRSLILKVFDLGVDYSKYSHSHCWQSEKPACGLKGKHCCLCNNK